jgi:transposase
VTAEGVPVWGHITDGHLHDSTAPRFHLTPLRQHLPDLGAPLVVADSQFVAGETMTLAAAHGFRFVTLGPQTVGRRQALVEAPELGALPRLWERPGRRTGETAHDRGAAVVCPSRGKTAAGEVQAWPRRWHSHQLTDAVSAAWVPVKRTTRGRPPKEAPRPQHQVWRVTWQVQEATEAMRLRAPREGRCVLATHGLEAQQFSDTERLRAYKGQPAAELRFTWAKNPAAIAPIVLEPPIRMAALGCLYVIALLVDTVVERQVRKRLVVRGETLPDRPAPSQHPTARTIFQLMRNIVVVTLQWARRSYRQVTMLNAHQLHVIRLLGDEPTIYGIPHRNAG